MKKPLTILKKETRILGMDFCNPRIIIGAVVRGGLFLDGVITFPRKTDTLGRKIGETRYFPELKLIMIHDVEKVIEVPQMHRIIGLPIIAVGTSGPVRARVSKSEGGSETRQWETIGLDPSMLARIHTITKTKGTLPEPLRIAHLLGKLHIFGGLRQEKG